MSVTTSNTTLPGKIERSVHITNYYHKNSGGISSSYDALMVAAGEHRRHMSLIVPGEADGEEIVNDYAKLYYVKANYSPIFDKRYRIILPWNYMPVGTRMRQIIMDEMPQMIEITDKYTLSMMGAMVRLGKFNEIGRPMLVHFSCERMDDNVGSFMSGGSLGKWFSRRVIGSYLAPSFDFHIANSTYTAEEFQISVESKYDKRRSAWFMNKCWRFFKAPRIPFSRRVRVCPRGVNIERFSPANFDADLRNSIFTENGLPDDAILLLYAGRVSPEKNVTLLADMMRELSRVSSKDFRLLIAGAGPLTEKLRSDTDQLGRDKVIFLGHLDKDLLAKYYSSVDVFVHPNPKEPFGIGPLEAMASGVPVVAPRSGGILSYANDSNAWLVEPNGEKFAMAVISATEDAADRESRIHNAVLTAQNNTRKMSTSRLLETYDEMYEDFLTRNDLYTDATASSKFDYRTVIDA